MIHFDSTFGQNKSFLTTKQGPLFTYCHFVCVLTIKTKHLFAVVMQKKRNFAAHKTQLLLWKRNTSL